MVDMEMAQIERQADAAASRGDFVRAAQLLSTLTTGEVVNAETWVKLSAMRRASNDLAGALQAIEEALARDPLAFIPLLMKASVLEALGDAQGAGKFSGIALFHAPKSASLSPLLRAQLDHARLRNERYIEDQDKRLSDAAHKAGTLVAAEERRINRFRSNILRKTKPYHSEPSDFHFPGLSECEFHDPETFTWLASVNTATPLILAEFNDMMAAEHAELVPYVQYPRSVPVDQWAELNNNSAWSAIHLVRHGQHVDANARHCPKTLAALSHVPQPDVVGCSPNIMFSLLAPGAHIPPHTGVANTRLVVHLPLIVPDGCRYRVGADVREWRVGHAWVFDDTIEHEAWNDSLEMRVVLIFDIWHSGLSDAERRACAAMMPAALNEDAQF